MEPMWSPQPIIGYRTWSVRRDRLEGLRSIWRTPTFRAMCTNVRSNGAVPHLGEPCACGVYAAKDPTWLRREFAGVGRPGVAVGRVELSGRVVEHTHGYRAAQADVVDIAVHTRRGVYRFQACNEIEQLFAHPHATLATALSHHADSAIAVCEEGGTDGYR